MIPLAIRTEYDFKKAYAPISKIVELPYDIIGVADDNSTFAHIPFAKAMKKAGKKPIFGTRLLVCKEMRERFNYGGFWIVLLARNSNGLKEINKLVKNAWDQFYYIPRISYDNFLSISKDIIIINASCVPSNGFYSLGN